MLTPAQVKAIQEVLAKKGFLTVAPSDDWTAEACSGYKHYQLHNGVQYPDCDLLPQNLGALNQELIDAVNGVVPAPVVATEKVNAPNEVPTQPAVAPKAETAIRIPKKSK